MSGKRCGGADEEKLISRPRREAWYRGYILMDQEFAIARLEWRLGGWKMLVIAVMMALVCDEVPL